MSSPWIYLFLTSGFLMYDFDIKIDVFVNWNSQDPFRRSEILFFNNTRWCGFHEHKKITILGWAIDINLLSWIKMGFSFFFLAQFKHFLYPLCISLRVFSRSMLLWVTLLIWTLIHICFAVSAHFLIVWKTFCLQTQTFFVTWNFL